MNRRRIAFVVLVGVIGWTVSGATFFERDGFTVERARQISFLPSYQHAPGPSVSDVALADTVTAGDVFVIQLPDSVSGVAIEKYSSDRLPLKSWLVERSFFWSTSLEDRGSHAFKLKAHPRIDQNANEATPEDASIIWTLNIVVQ